MRRGRRDGEVNPYTYEEEGLEVDEGARSEFRWRREGKEVAEEGECDSCEDMNRNSGCWRKKRR